MRHIVGLDLGPNSIGWASLFRNGLLGQINAANSRIIPMSADELNAFQSGNTKSKAKVRREKRTPRRMRERFLLRRERLHRILNILGFLPNHYRDSLGWDLVNDPKHYGTFLEGRETKLAWMISNTCKAEFLFEDAFKEMAAEFKAHRPELKSIPHDWTIYYLRKKALSQPISKEELAWIILQFNQKRGYELQRDEELVKSDDKMQEYKEVVVKSVEAIGENSRGTTYKILFEDSDLPPYERTSKHVLNWEGRTIAIIVTTNLNEDGTPKRRQDGSRDISISIPKNDSDIWKAKKLKTEQDLNEARMTVGQFIYNRLLSQPSTKIRGKFIHTIERNYYRDELKAILRKQAEFIPELTDRKLYQKCIMDLYKQNKVHCKAISRNDFTYLILEDVLYYQRPVGSNKHLVSRCPYESHKGIDKMTGEIKDYPIPCVATSNPIFQEFRVWKFLSDLHIIQRSHLVDDHMVDDEDVTSQYLNSEQQWEDLFLWLNNKSEVTQQDLLSHVGIMDDDAYRWNYVEDKTYPLNRTRAAILRKLKPTEKKLLTKDLEAALWHLLYSTSSMKEINKSLSPNNRKHSIYQKLSQAGLTDESIEKLKKIKFMDEGYASYSAKAIKKLLYLMRRGSLWSAEKIDNETLARINNILNRVNLERYPEKVRKRLLGFHQLKDFSGLTESLVCYIVYGRHSEAAELQKWTSPSDIDVFLTKFRQHSLNNPVVESVVCETLRVVRDIWIKFGKIDEFHIELGRDLKNPKDKRAKITNQILANEATNIRIKRLLAELQAEAYKVANVKPYSPYQRELLHIYEDEVLTQHTMSKEISEIQQKLSDITKEPSPSDYMKYKCWIDQKYISPYTGQAIPLSRLFTEDYAIEHVIPKAKFFDDSFANKVICETEVNDMKEDMLAMEFIRKHGGTVIPLSGGRKPVTILCTDDYIRNVNSIYPGRQSSVKRRNLLLDEIPESFTRRQLNDSRYISRLVMSLLSNIVRATDSEGNITEREVTSKNVVVCNGAITARLKHDWGMNDVWNQMMLPRFQRMNRLTGRDLFTTTNTNGHLIPAMPLELQKGFDIKRIDHRHHAMDAIVIACATSDHVQLLNNEYARPEHKEMKYRLSHELRRYEEEIIKGKKRNVPKEFIMPWPTFKEDARTALNKCIISFRQNLRVLTIAHNHYQVYKEIKEQNSKKHFAIRKPLHQETFYGHVNLKRLKEKGVTLKVALQQVELIVDKELKTKIKDLLSQGFTPQQIVNYFKTHDYEWKRTDFKKIQVYYYTDDDIPQVASRFGNDLVSVFTFKNEKPTIEKIKSRIQKISDTGIQKILTHYFMTHATELEFAISAEGFIELNKNIASYNNNTPHKPIFKVRCIEKMGKKYPVGEKYNTNHKYVQADDGTNLFFAIYSDSEGKRSYKTIPLYEVIAKLKENLPPVDDYDESGNKLLFYLNPDDLVYVPTPEESESVGHEISDNMRIYRFVDSSGTTANFVPHTSAHVIFHIDANSAKKYSDSNTAAQFSSKGIIQDEYGVGSPQSKNQKAITGEMIKEVCIPIKVDRLGNIIKIGY